MDSTFAQCSDVFIDGEINRSVVKKEGSGSESVQMHSLSNLEDDDLEVIALQREAGRQLDGSNDISGFMSTSFSAEGKFFIYSQYSRNFSMTNAECPSLTIPFL